MNLRDCLAGMVGVERSLLADVIQWTEGGISDPRVAATGEQLEQTVKGHLAALELRLVDPDSSEGPVLAPLPFPAIDSPTGRNRSVRALHGWYTGVTGLGAGHRCSPTAHRKCGGSRRPDGR